MKIFKTGNGTAEQNRATHRAGNLLDFLDEEKMMIVQLPKAQPLLFTTLSFSEKGEDGKGA